MLQLSSWFVYIYPANPSPFPPILLVIHSFYAASSYYKHQCWLGGLRLARSVFFIIFYYFSSQKKKKKGKVDLRVEVKYHERWGVRRGKRSQEIDT